MNLGCCSQSKSLTQTLGQCSWTSCGGTCPAGTTALTQTLTGDGGDSPCLSGRRSLCCPTGGQVSFVPNTCGWYRNAWHNTCTPGCPQGKVQLAVDSAGASCVRGYGSFCCDPPANTAMIGSGDPQMREFARFVHAFMVDGVCDRTNQAPVKQKRKKRQFSSLLNPNSHDVALLLAPLLYDWLWSSSERVYITPFRDIWDAENEQNGNVFPSFGILADAYFHFYPIEGDAIDYIDSVLCDGDDGAAAIDSSAAASAHLCVEINGSQKRGGVPDLVPRDEMGPVDAFNKTHSKRAFTDDFTEGGHRKKGQPESGDAFEMMDNGYLRVEYFKWFRYQGNEIEMESKQFAPHLSVKFSRFQSLTHRSFSRFHPRPATRQHRRIPPHQPAAALPCHAHPLQPQRPHRRQPGHQPNQHPPRARNSSRNRTPHAGPL